MQATDPQGKLYGGVAGLSVLLVHESLKVAQAVIQAGKTIAQAVDDALAWI